MDRSLDRVARTGGSLLVGAVGTAALAVGLLWAVQPLGQPIYETLFPVVGPWTATEAATVLTFTIATLAAISLPTVLTTAYRTTPATARTVGTILAGLLGLAVGALALAAVFGVAGWLAAICACGAFVVGVPTILRLQCHWPTGMIVFAGGVPVVVLFLLLLGFGLGWGGGYDLVAESVPAPTGTAVEADFDSVPAVRDDLLTPADSDETYAYCETDGDTRTCILPLRGYAHEAQAARFLDRHGVRCPFLNGPSSQPSDQSFLATDDGRYYRVSCRSYGD